MRAGADGAARQRRAGARHRRLSRRRLLPQPVHPVPAGRQRHPQHPAAGLARRDRRRAGAGHARRGLGCGAGAALRRPIRSSPTISPNGSAIRCGARPSLVWAPGPRQTLERRRTTRGKLIVDILDNVRGRAFALDYADGALALDRDRAAAQRDDRPRPPPPTRTTQAMFSVTDYLTPHHALLL